MDFKFSCGEPKRWSRSGSRSVASSVDGAVVGPVAAGVGVLLPACGAGPVDSGLGGLLATDTAGLTNGLNLLGGADEGGYLISLVRKGLSGRTYALLSDTLVKDEVGPKGLGLVTVGGLGAVFGVCGALWAAGMGCETDEVPVLVAIGDTWELSAAFGKDGLVGSYDEDFAASLRDPEARDCVESGAAVVGFGYEAEEAPVLAEKGEKWELSAALGYEFWP